MGMRAIAREVAASIEIRTEGIHHVPQCGPAILVCRHYHHLYDGVALLTAIARPVRIMVGLDWVKSPRQRWYMESLCRLAGWPIVLRDPVGGNPWGAGYRSDERFAYSRSALLRSTDVLRRGEILAIFPEGSPMIDPSARVQRAMWPPFGTGYLSIALRASRLGIAAPLVPAGFAYAGPPAHPRTVSLRFGEPVLLPTAERRTAVAHDMESRVRGLSA